MRVRVSASVTLSVLVLVVLAGCLGGASPFENGHETTLDGNSDRSLGGLADQSAASGSAGNFSIHFIHVGQGTSVLVVGPSGETLLYDTGNWNDDGEHVLDYLRARNVTRIDYLVTSHADADHIGGHAEVIDYYETQAGGIGAIYDPGIAAGTRTYEEYLDAVEKHNVTLVRAQAGDEIPMAGVQIGVLSPPEGYLDGRERNENSLVLQLASRNVSVLLTGDAEEDAEEYLTETYGDQLNVTLLSAGHHGSNTSTGPGLLGVTTPRVVTIQSAYDSPYGHPHRELLGRLADRRISTYWTGVHGTVVFETDGHEVVISTQSSAPTAPRDLRSGPGVAPGSTDSLERRAVFGGGPAGERPTVLADGGEETENKTDKSLVVAEVHADAAGDDRENLNDEYLVFRNSGDETLDLSGWTVSDEADHSYTFPAGTTLAPGETLTLHTGQGTDRGADDETEGHYYWGSGQPIWNNAGDTVFVRTDEGKLVLEVEYDGR